MAKFIPNITAMGVTIKDTQKDRKMKTFPTLYKKTSTGAIQYWTIKTEESNLGFTLYPTIVTEYGQLGTDSPQTTYDHIKEGKNAGKKNETSAEEQADREAQSKWEKQKKKGYVETLEAAKADETDDLIEGGIVPMLAQKFTDHGHKIKYPCYAQPKLDGIRCIAIIKDGRCTLWTRTRKPITSVPHIVATLEKGLPKREDGKEIILDGELYNHEFKTNFEKIVSMVRQEEPAPDHRLVQYHVYDIISEQPFSKRAVALRYLKTSWFDGSIVKVDTVLVENESQVTDVFENWRAEGYEGAMLRNSDGLYVNKRSYDLQKVKEFDDDEFPIVGFEEGRGKLAGHIGAFVCRTKGGKEFLAKMRGETSRLKEYFDDHALWSGKLLTVQYQGLTGKEGVPRFPVGVTMRDYE